MVSFRLTETYLLEEPSAAKGNKDAATKSSSIIASSQDSKETGLVSLELRQNGNFKLTET